MRQSSARTAASSRVSNCSQGRNSSRKRPLNDSENLFCHGEPGLMTAVSIRDCRHKSRIAWAVSSVVLAILMLVDQRPVSAITCFELGYGLVGGEGPTAGRGWGLRGCARRQR